MWQRSEVILAVSSFLVLGGISFWLHENDPTIRRGISAMAGFVVVDILLLRTNCALQFAQDVFQITIHSTFSTSVPAILGDIFGLAYVAIQFQRAREKQKEEQKRQKYKHPRKGRTPMNWRNVRNGLQVIGIVLGVGIVGNCLYLLFSPRPTISAIYQVMPSNPPYPPDTVIGGIKFHPLMHDIRLHLSSGGTEIYDAEIAIHLVNSTGRLLNISNIGQMPSASPPCQFSSFGNYQTSIRFPTTPAPPGTPPGPYTVPLGAESPYVPTITNPSPVWHLYCEKILANVIPELVLEVLPNHQDLAKPPEGFLLEGRYKYEINGWRVSRRFWNAVLFDAHGNPYTPNATQEKEIIKRIRGSYIDFRDSDICISR